MTEGSERAPRLMLGSGIYGLTSPSALSARRRDGKDARATLRIIIPAGKRERVIEVELTAAQCASLAVAAVSAVEILHTADTPAAAGD